MAGGDHTLFGLFPKISFLNIDEQVVRKYIAAFICCRNVKECQLGAEPEVICTFSAESKLVRSQSACIVCKLTKPQAFLDKIYHSNSEML